MQGLRVNHAKLIRMLAAYRSAFRSRTCARGLSPASSNFQVPLNQSLVLSRPSRSKNDRTPPPRGCVPQHPCWLCSGIQHGFRWVPLRRVGPCKLVSISVPEVATSHFCEHHSRLAVNRCQVLNCFFPTPFRLSFLSCCRDLGFGRRPSQRTEAEQFLSLCESRGRFWATAI